MISALLSSSPHALFNNELLVARLHADQRSVLSSHDFPAHYVGSHVLVVVSSSSRSVEITDVFLGLFLGLHLVHLSEHLSLNLGFSLLVFASETSNIGGRVFASAVLGVVSLHHLLVGLTVDSVYSIVETLAFNIDRVFKIQVLLRDVLTDDSSADSSEITEVAFFLPVADEGATSNLLSFTGLVKPKVCHN